MDTIYLFTNLALIMVCTVYAIVFLILPLPDNKGLRTYRISLRTLAVAYLIMATLTFVFMILGDPIVNLISMLVITVASLQAILFTTTLITLLNHKRVNKQFVLRHLSPVIFFVLLFGVVSSQWGDPMIINLDQLKQEWLHPTIIVRELFFLFYIFQLFYLTRLFIREIRCYQRALDDYFSENYRLHLPWVRYCFYAALTIGCFALLSCFFFSPFWILIFTISYTLFYIVFGSFYIQYPRTYIQIEPLVQEKQLPSSIQLKANCRLSWSKLKQQIIDEKYYTRTGVNIEEMAQYLQIGRTTLSCFINKEEGVNFNTWIRTLRVEEAINLMNENSGYTITQISEMVGYSELSNFSRQFKIITGLTPSEWCQQKRILA